MKKLTFALVSGLGVVTLYCGMVAVSVGSLKAADVPSCDCVLGYDKCQQVSCVTGSSGSCNQGGIDCSTWFTGKKAE
jgi:hypothetical protein